MPHRYDAIKHGLIRDVKPVGDDVIRSYELWALQHGRMKVMAISDRCICICQGILESGTQHRSTIIDRYDFDSKVHVLVFEHSQTSNCVPLNVIKACSARKRTIIIGYCPRKNWYSLDSGIKLEEASKTDNSSEMGHTRNPTNDQAHGCRNEIIDIRSDAQEINLLEVTKNSLKTTESGIPQFPDLLLWDKKGLKGFEEVTYLDDYYLTHNELDLLKQHGNEIALNIKPNSVLIELGSG